MYTIKDREKFFNNIINNVKLSHNIIGTYLIGSSSIGFNDIYSDTDFMIAYKEETTPEIVHDEILNFFNKEEVGYVMERKWSERIWGISVYMKNGLSADISFGPLNDLKIKSPQISVGVDTDSQLEKHLIKGQEIFKEKYSNYNITNNINWEFMYLIRKYLIAIKRENLIYAYQLLNDARIIIMKIEGLNEGKKLHEFKSYNELSKEFLIEIEKTIPNNLTKEDLNKCKDKLLSLFSKVINNCKILDFDENTKYLLEIAD